MLTAMVYSQVKINSCVECSAMSWDKYILPKLGYLSTEAHAVTSMRGSYM
jgi:hypothetical protein